MPVFTLAALKTECQTDPQALGLAAPYANGADGVCAAMLNAISQSISVKRTDVRPAEILEAIHTSDFIASPTVPACSWFESLTQLPAVRMANDDGTDTMVLGNLKRLLVNVGQGSQARLIAISSRAGSRAEQLWGPGFAVTEVNISDTRAL